MKKIRDGLTYTDKVRLLYTVFFVCFAQFIMIMLKCFGLIDIAWPWVLFLMWGIPLGLVAGMFLMFVLVIVIMLINYWRSHFRI